MSYSNQPVSPSPYGPGASPDSRTLGLLSFIGGIASIIFGQTIILPVAAIILGFVARRREPDSGTLATWGIVLSVIALFGWILVLVLVFAFSIPLFFLATA